MQSAFVLFVFFVGFCLTLNYSFPLHKSDNSTKKADNMVEQSRKMAVSALKKIKISTQDMGKNIYDHLNFVRQAPSDSEIKEYQQLVIKKKYPYVEFKRFDLFHPSAETTRHNLKGYSGPALGNDPGICEAVEEAPTVEITNRGLSGFAIPPVLSHKTEIADITELQSGDSKLSRDKIHVTILSNNTAENVSSNNTFGSFKDELKAYLLGKNSVNTIIS